MGIFMKLTFLKRFECLFHKADTSTSVHHFLKHSRLSRAGVRAQQTIRPTLISTSLFLQYKATRKYIFAPCMGGLVALPKFTGTHSYMWPRVERGTIRSELSVFPNKGTFQCCSISDVNGVVVQFARATQKSVSRYELCHDRKRHSSLRFCVRQCS